MTARSRRRTVLSAVLLAGLLGGCELPSINQLVPALPALPALQAWPDLGLLDKQACAKVSEEDVKRVNWTRVPQVNMHIRSGEFEPMVIQMKQGWPYVFRIRNRDDSDHMFTSRDFFKNMAMLRITVNGDRKSETCIEKIKVPARQTVEMRLVAAVDGRFEFEDSPIPIAGLFWSKGASGVIIVEESFTVRYQ